MTKNSKILWIIKLVVGIVLVTLVYRSIYRHDQISQAFQSAHWQNILICFVLLIPNYYIQFLKWRYILRRPYKNIENRLVIQSLLFGSTLGFITPGNLGELTRALYFRKYDRVVLFGLNIIDKLSGMLIFITMGLLAMTVLMVTQFQWSKLMVVSFIVFNTSVLIALWLLALNPRFLSQLVRKMKWTPRLKDKIRHLFSGLEHLRRRDAVMILALSLVWFAVIILQYHSLISAFQNVRLWDSLLSVSAALFTKVVLPISIGDLGIREGATVYYYSLFGVAKTAAFNAAILIFIINFLVPALAGSYFVFRLRWANSRNRPDPNPAESGGKIE